MSIARITGPGLAAISLSVMALWGCFLGEQLTARRATRERSRVLYQLREMQRRRDAQPVLLPVLGPSRPARPSAG